MHQQIFPQLFQVAMQINKVEELEKVCQCFFLQIAHILQLVVKTMLLNPIEIVLLLMENIQFEFALSVLLKSFAYKPSLPQRGDLILKLVDILHNATRVAEAASKIPYIVELSEIAFIARGLSDMKYYAEAFHVRLCTFKCK